MNRIALYIDHRFRGGAQRVMVNLANYFAQKGIEVMLICDIDINKEVSRLYPGTSRYPLSENVKEIVLKEALSSNKNLNKNYLRIRELRKCIKNFKPDIVLSFLGPNNLRMLIATIGLKCKKVVSVRNDPVQEYGNSYAKRLITNIIFLFADGCVFQTEMAKDYFWKPIKYRSTIIFNPVDKKFFMQKRSKTVKNIISVGRFDKQKNHLLLIRAFAKIAHIFPGENLILYGTGVLKKDMEQLAEKLNISDRVIFPGVADNIEKKLAESRLFVLSSDFEGMPNALMEAMAVGVPCISTDCRVGGPRLLFGKELEQYLVPCNNEKVLSKCIGDMLNKSEIENDMISKELKKRAELFNPEKIFAQWKEYFERL